MGLDGRLLAQARERLAERKEHNAQNSGDARTRSMPARARHVLLTCVCAR